MVKSKSVFACLIMWKVLLFVLLNISFVFSQQCREPSLQNVWVRIYKNETQNMVDQRISGCITPAIIHGYKQDKLLGIKIINQTIPTINTGVVSNFKDNFSITMENNQIDTVKEGAFFNLDGITSISLISSNIKWVETKVFANLPSLKYLNLENNRIEGFSHGTFENLAELERLDLSFNKLQHFKKEWFNNVPNLKILEMPYNSIKTIPEAAFQSLPSLKNLNLYGNEIRTIHRQGFDGLSSLDILNLGNNSIKVFEVNFNSALGLLLNLENNYIDYISEVVLNELSSTKTLVLRSNPLQCGCYEKIIMWASRNRVYINWNCNDENPVCVVPKTNLKKCYRRSDDDFPMSYVDFKKELKKCSYKVTN